MIGRSLAHYRILRELGSGGMGTVYLAEDTTLGRQVALKVLPDEVAGDASRLERFEREARTVASFNHPNIVTLHTVEESDGIRFLTMEHVEGKTLDRLIPSGGMELPGLFEIAIPLADALSAAHAGGITHRDLKPANVMVTDDGRVKILDFGLAKPVASVVGSEEATLAAAEALTQDGTLVGTVPYMSPEQIEGKSVDARSDIFSLGVLLYQMATGQHPFSGDSSTSLLASILKDEPRPVLEHRVELPRQLDRIVHHCLEKDPRRRFQSALDVRNELEALKREEESQVPSRSVVRPAPSPARPAAVSRGTWLGGLALVALAVVAGLWLIRDSGTDPDGSAATVVESEREMVVVLPFENLGAAEDEYFAAGIAEEITSRLASAGGLGVISRNSARRYAGTQKSIQEIGAELGVGYVLEGTVRWARENDRSRVRITPQLIRVADDRQLWADTYDHVLENIFEVQSDIAGRVIEQLGVTLGDREREMVESRPTENLEAYQAYLRGLDSTGRRTYSKDDRLLEVQMFERAVELDPGFVQAWAQLAMAHAALMNLGYDNSPERLAASRAAVDRALEIEPESPEAHIALVYHYYWGKRDYDAALATLADAEKLAPGEGRLLRANAWIARRQGRWDDAIHFATEAARLDPVASDLPRELGVMFLSTRDAESAIEALDRSIALAPDQQAAYALKALVHWQEGDLTAGRAALEELPGEESTFSAWFSFLQAFYERDWDAAAQAVTRLPGGLLVVTPDVRPARAQLLADVEARRGNRQLAATLWRQARAELEAALERSPDDARLHGSLGRALAGLGDREAALAAGRRAVELYPLGRDALHGSRSHFELAAIATTVGDAELALEQLEILLTANTWFSVPLLRLDPTFEPLWNDPGFEALGARFE